MKQRKYYTVDLNFRYGQFIETSFRTAPSGEISFVGRMFGRPSNRSRYIRCLEFFIPLKISINTKTILPQLMSNNIPYGIEFNLNRVIREYTAGHVKKRRNGSSIS